LHVDALCGQGILQISTSLALSFVVAKDEQSRYICLQIQFAISFDGFRNSSAPRLPCLVDFVIPRQCGFCYANTIEWSWNVTFVQRCRLFHPVRAFANLQGWQSDEHCFLFGTWGEMR